MALNSAGQYLYIIYRYDFNMILIKEAICFGKNGPG